MINEEKIDEIEQGLLAFLLLVCCSAPVSVATGGISLMVKPSLVPRGRSCSGTSKSSHSFQSTTSAKALGEALTEEKILLPKRMEAFT